MIYSYWAFIGTIVLIILMWQDHKNNMTIDDKRNIFMVGLTVSIVSHNRPSIWYFLILIMLIHFLLKTLEKRNVFASGDTSALRWIMLGFGLIDIYKLIAFMLFFTISTLLFFGLKKLIEKTFKLNKNIHLPFFGVILITFWLNCFIYGLY